MENKQSINEMRILQRYPQAKPATRGVKVGDVILNHPDVPGVLLTKEILERFDGHKYYWVIANLGDGYKAIADITAE